MNKKSILFLALLLFFLFLGCQKDDSQNYEVDQINNSDGIISKALTTKDAFSKNSSLKRILKSVKQKFKNKNSQSLNITILGDYIKFIEYEDYHSYTFNIITNSGFKGIQNLLIDLKSDGTYEAKIVSYAVSIEELLAYSRGEKLDLTAKISFNAIDINIDELFKNSLQEA
ncbi:MAG TPA: hypothetical protein VFM59_03445, partial [Salinimicrobium sp.]|nr:hypothetical protein [Salinimicrobium sp.]